jgi:hypothetical protein
MSSPPFYVGQILSNPSSIIEVIKVNPSDIIAKFRVNPKFSNYKPTRPFKFRLKQALPYGAVFGNQLYIADYTECKYRNKLDALRRNSGIY